MLLILAIGPIVGVAWLSVQSWNRTGQELAELDTRVRPVSAAYRSFQFTNLLSRTHASIAAAALPEASPEIRALAETHIEAFNDELAVVLDELEPLAEDLAVGLGESPEVTIDMARFTQQAAVAEVKSHTLGEPPSQGLTYIATLVRDQLAAVVVPGVASGDERVRDAEELLIGLISIDADYDHDLQIIVAAALGDQQVDEAQLRTYDIRRVNWNAVNGVWTISFGDVVAATLARGTVQASNVDDNTNPIKNSVATLTAATNEGDALSPAMLEALEVDLRLSEQLTRAHADVLSTADEVRAELRRGRNLAAGAGVLMALLGCALFGLTFNETRARRRVGAAHQEALAEMERKAHRDPTTGLHNRRWLDAQLPAGLASRVADHEVVVAYIDLDRFKSINDVWGHHVGDEVLSAVGQRLSSFKWEDRVVKVARFGGDEFVGFVEVTPDMALAEIGDLGRAVIDRISEPIVIDRERHDIDASVGITVSTHDSTARTLLLEADTALLEAKRTQRGRAHVYDREQTRVGELMQALPAALSSGEITVHLQPAFDTTTQTVQHYEALARWTRPDGESVRPDVFVPLAEAFGLTEALTRAVLLNVRELRATHGAALPRVWINISPVEFNGRRLSERLLAMLDELDIPTTAIGIEVTESAAIGDQVSTGRELAKLRSRGIKVAIDDFGAGYSPLGHLRQLPIDLLKIDRSLIDNVDTDTGAQMMVAGIVGFAGGLGIEVLAEGVERPEELQFVADQGIPLVQGYLLGRPTAPSNIDWDQQTSDHALRPKLGDRDRRQLRPERADSRV